MNLTKTKLLASLLLAASASMAQASTYSVTGLFDEPMVADTVFNGTFNWDGTALTGLTGTMNSSMEYAPTAPNLTLNQNAIWGLNGSVVTASIFLNPSSIVFADGGFNAATSSTAPTPNPGNAFFTFSFDTAGGMVTPTGLTTSMQYGDCSALGMMGSTCMTGYGPVTGTRMGNPSGAGSMFAYAQALTITPATAVPLPAAAWLFGGGLMSLLGVNRRKHVLPA
jgi:hypothetical protein